MDLKTNETNYSYDNETEKTYSNPNDALFGNMEEDTPYKITNTYSSTKPKINSSTNVIITVALVIICIGCAVFFYTQMHKYDGKYEMVSVSVAGYEFTLEELQAYSGQVFSGSLDVKGNKVYVVMSEDYNSDSGYGSIKIKDGKVTIKDSSETIKGTYNASEKTISLNLYGGELVFKKVD